MSRVNGSKRQDDLREEHQPASRGGRRKHAADILQLQPLGRHVCSQHEQRECDRGGEGQVLEDAAAL